jgi:ATP-dependent RNA helicase DDX5/DBP2
MGFEPQVRSILERVRPDRQTALFSATWPKEVQVLAQAFCKNEETVHIQMGSATLRVNPNIS